jgi:spoIIIJ-associated protein
MTHQLAAGDRLEREPVIAELRRFLDLVVQQLQLQLQYEIRPLDPAPDDVERLEVLVVFRGPDQDLLLERNGELLLALEYIGLRWLRLEPRFYDHVRFDAGEYRALRLEELKLAARVAADRVRETRQPFRLNPMSARERRIVHLALQDVPGVRTSSEGAGESRQVVIYPAQAAAGKP